MICIEIRPSFGASEIVSLDSENNEFRTRDFEDFIKEFFRISEEKSVASRTKKFYDSLHFITGETANKETYSIKNSCKRVVLGLEELNGNISEEEWASRIVGELIPVLQNIEKIIIVIEDREQESADVRIYDYKNKTKINRNDESPHDLTEYKGVEKARGYDIKSEIEEEIGISLFWDWEKWNTIEVSTKI